MIRIGLILERRRRLLSLRYPRLSATGSGKRTAVEVALARHKDSFLADDDARFEPAIAAPIKHNEIKMSCCRTAFRAKCFNGQGSAKGNTFTVLSGTNKLTSATLLSDQRGAVAFETLIVWSFMMLSLLLPLADVAAAGFQYISAWQALRGFGQSIQYDKPDFTNASGWTSGKLAKADPRFPIQQFRLVCGDANLDCSAGNSASPQYYSYATTITLSPIVLSAVLCTSSNANKCSFTLSYSEQMFQ
jgi:hypothetical protein